MAICFDFDPDDCYACSNPAPDAAELRAIRDDEEGSGEFFRLAASAALVDLDRKDVVADDWMRHGVLFHLWIHTERFPAVQLSLIDATMNTPRDHAHLFLASRRCLVWLPLLRWRSVEGFAHYFRCRLGLLEGRWDGATDAWIKAAGTDESERVGRAFDFMASSRADSEAVAALFWFLVGHSARLLRRTLPEDRLAAVGQDARAIQLSAFDRAAQLAPPEAAMAGLVPGGDESLYKLPAYCGEFRGVPRFEGDDDQLLAAARELLVAGVAQQVQWPTVA